MTNRSLLVAVLTTLIAACAVAPEVPDAAEAGRQVFATEAAFARTMEERNLEAFADFVAEDAVFLTNGDPLRGKRQIVDGWSAYFTDPSAPFSWAPEEVEVLESGGLALSSGPVRDTGGSLIGRFTSIWRHEGGGRWRIVFDRGSPVCRCGTPPIPGGSAGD